MGEPNATVADNNLRLTRNAMIYSIDDQPRGGLGRYDGARPQAKAKKGEGDTGKPSRERYDQDTALDCYQAPTPEGWLSTRETVQIVIDGKEPCRRRGFGYRVSSEPVR